MPWEKTSTTGFQRSLRVRPKTLRQARAAAAELSRLSFNSLEAWREILLADAGLSLIRPHRRSSFARALASSDTAAASPKPSAPVEDCFDALDGAVELGTDGLLDGGGQTPAARRLPEESEELADIRCELGEGLGVILPVCG